VDELKKTIEAALFISGRWLNVEDLARIAGSASIGDVKERLAALQHEYERHAGGVMVFEENGRYKMEVASDIRDRVYYLAPEPELSPALIKTLAFIAYKQPVNQSQVVQVIGNRAYDYIKELRHKEFISIKRKGRTKQMTTTGRFRKYFGLKEGEMPWADMREAEESLKAEAEAEEDRLKEATEEGKLEDASKQGTDEDVLDEIGDLESADDGLEEPEEADSAIEDGDAGDEPEGGDNEGDEVAEDEPSIEGTNEDGQEVEQEESGREV